MDNLTPYYLLLALIPLLYLVRICRGSLNSPDHALRLPPSPWELPLIGSVHHILSTLPHRALRDLSRRHGPLMLLKLGKAPIIVVSSAGAAKEIMKTHDTAFCTRPLSSAVKVFTKHGKGMTFSPYAEGCRQLRKICVMELLSPKRVQSFRHVREHETMRLVESVSAAASSESETGLVNLSKMISRYVTDATVRAIMGHRFKDQDTLIHIIDEVLRLITGFALPDLFPSSRLAHALSGKLRGADAHRETVYVFLDRVVNEHLERRSSEEAVVNGHQDLIDVLLRIKEEGNDLQFPLTMNMIKAVIFELLAGGSETTTSTTQWAMAELMRNPGAMSRAQAEVRRAFMGQTKVTEEALGELSYIKCVIKETMRLHTPAPLLLPRQCQERCKILGYDVPKGATVLVNAWAISRDPECWENPEEFVPERFQGSSARDWKGHSFEYTPFGAGRRMCPGMYFGLANIELALASLLFHFDWTLPDGVLPADLDMAETMGITIRKKEDLLLRATLQIQFTSES